MTPTQTLLSLMTAAKDGKDQVYDVRQGLVVDPKTPVVFSKVGVKVVDAEGSLLQASDVAAALLAVHGLDETQPAVLAARALVASFSSSQHTTPAAAHPAIEADAAPHNSPKPAATPAPSRSGPSTAKKGS